MSKPANRKGVPLDLTEQERQTLQQRTKARQRSVADRARVLLALADGQNSVQIAEKTGLHPVSIRRIKCLFQTQRLAVLQAGKPTGRRPVKRQAVEEFLEHQGQRGMLQTPKLGVWSIATVVRKLHDEQQMSVCPNTVRAALKKRDILTDAPDTV